MMKWLINPFERVAGWQALAIGLCFMTLTAVLGKLNNIYFPSNLFYQGYYLHTFSEALCAQIKIWGILSIVVWIAGLLSSKSTIRIIDVAGTMALSHAPLLIIVLLGFLPLIPKPDNTDIFFSLLWFVLCLIPVIWMVALMYKAYIVACNPDKTRSILSFICALVIAEIFSLAIFFSVDDTFPFTSDNQHNNIVETVIPPGQTLQQTASIVVDAFKNADYKTINMYADDKIKATSDVLLRRAWGSIIVQHGQLTHAETNVKPTPYDQYQILLIPLTFEKGTIKMRLVFNSEGKIAGIQFI